MTRRLLAALLLAATLLPATAARADRFVPDAEYRPTPRWVYFEAKFGPYKPNVDQEFSGATPYKDIFGDGLKLMSQFTLDVEFLKLHGVLAVGGSFGYFGASGKALTATGERSGDKTGLNVMPFLLSLVYRWDYPIHKWGFPLVPYVRAGIGAALFWITDGAGDTASFGDGKKARGAAWGYQVNVGVAFHLNVLEPSAAKKLDMELGINNTFLFIEFVHNRFDDFGSSKSIDLSMTYSMLAGLAFEF